MDQGEIKIPGGGRWISKQQTALYLHNTRVTVLKDQ